MKKVTVASVAIALMAGTSALAQTAKYDLTVAKAAAAKAAEKIGDIRGSIDFDEIPRIVTKEDLAEKTVNTSFLPKIPDQKEERLPPITSLTPQIDGTVTGSIQDQRQQRSKRIVWEKFDRYGNPIK